MSSLPIFWILFNVHDRNFEYFVKYVVQKEHTQFLTVFLCGIPLVTTYTENASQTNIMYSFIYTGKRNVKIFLYMLRNTTQKLKLYEQIKVIQGQSLQFLGGVCHVEGMHNCYQVVSRIIIHLCLILCGILMYVYYMGAFHCRHTCLWRGSPLLEYRTECGAELYLAVKTSELFNNLSEYFDYVFC